jgi:hypothetical protein
VGDQFGGTVATKIYRNIFMLTRNVTSYYDDCPCFTGSQSYTILGAYGSLLVLQNDTQGSAEKSHVVILNSKILVNNKMQYRETPVPVAARSKA